MIKQLSQFSIKLILILACTVAMHLCVLYFLKKPLLDHLIIRAYLFNAILAIATFAILNFQKEKRSNSLGFIFMGLSAVKFVFFFIFFRPHYLIDNVIERVEFITFFLPYSICLTLETISLVKILNFSDIIGSESALEKPQKK